MTSKSYTKYTCLSSIENGSRSIHTRKPGTPGLARWRVGAAIISSMAFFHGQPFYHTPNFVPSARLFLSSEFFLRRCPDQGLAQLSERWPPALSRFSRSRPFSSFLSPHLLDSDEDGSDSHSDVAHKNCSSIGPVWRSDTIRNIKYVQLLARSYSALTVLQFLVVAVVPSFLSRNEFESFVLPYPFGR